MILGFFETPLELAAQVIDLIGIAILLLSAMKFVYHYLAFEVGRYRRLDCVVQIRDMRLQLGSYILLALEFMIVSDVIHSALNRTLDDFLVLGILVLIRTALSFFLGVDLRDAQAEVSRTLES